MGVVVGEENIRPTFYPYQEIVDGKSIEEVTDSIISICSNNETPKIDLESVTSWDYAKNNLWLCIQKKSKEEIIKRDFLDLEMYVRVKLPSNILLGDGTGISSYKVKSGMFPIEDSVILDMALEQTKEDFVVENMVSVLSKLMGCSEEELANSIPENNGMLVVSNQSKLFGAAAICDNKMLNKIAEKYDSNLTIIPSSIHECIVLFGDEQPDEESCSSMVQMVNGSEVIPEEQLSDHAYFYDKFTGKITY